MKESKPKPISGVCDQTGEMVPEHVRRPLATTAMYGGWLGGLAMFIYAVFNFDPSKGEFAPQWVSFSFFLLLFTAVAGTLVRSRMRLSDTIIAALKAGADMNERQNKRLMAHVTKESNHGNGN